MTTCAGDPFAFCGMEIGRRFLSVYQKGKNDDWNETQQATTF